MASSGFRYLALLLACLAGAKVWAMPAQVVILRHAEKPSGEEGTELNAKGFKRAKALVGFFKRNPEINQFGSPVAIYSMAPKDANGSIRSIQTMIPLSEALGLEINQKFPKKKYALMVKEIITSPQYEGQLVVICGAHDILRDIARALGAVRAPKWDSEIFDRIWVLNFSEERFSSFRNLPQNLLPGDSSR